MESGWQQNYFNIADHHVGISFRKGQPNSMELIPSFEPFRTEICSEGCVLELKVDDTLPPVPQEKRKHIRVFDTGNGLLSRTSVDAHVAYLLLIKRFPFVAAPSTETVQ